MHAGGGTVLLTGPWAGPPWLVWRLVSRGRRRRLALAEDEAAASVAA